MRFEDVHGEKHKTFLGTLKVDLKDAYAKKIRKTIVNAMIQNQVEGYESDPAVYDEDPTVYIASTQDELVKILNRGVKTVHLHGEQFTIPGAVDGITYIGIGNPVVRFDGRQVKANIDVQDVEFYGDDYLEDVDGFYHVFQNASDLAVRLLRKTAEKENAAAQTLLAVCYRDEFGVKGNGADAVGLLQKAAERGYAAAQMMYGLYRMDYACGVRKFYADTFAEGIRWIQKAAQQGYAKAQVLLGTCYLNGSGAFLFEDAEDNEEEIVSELMKAVQWIQKAAEQKNKDAQTILGICHMEDGNALWNVFGPESIRVEARDEWVKMLDIKRSNAQAINWFKRAAEQGQPEGQALLGCCFLEGLVDTKNLAEGMNWLRKAADQGCSEAQELVKSCQPKNHNFAMDSETASVWRNRISDNFLSKFLNSKIESWHY